MKPAQYKHAAPQNCGAATTKNAVITVYLTLVLIIVTTLIFTVIESARVSFIRSHLQSISYMAADSVFSEFAEPIFDSYGAMMLWCNNDSFIEEYNSFVDNNLENDKLLSIAYLNLFNASRTETSLSTFTRPTDNGGKVFADQIIEYMKYYLGEDVAEKLLSNNSIFDQSDRVDKFMDKIDSYSDTFKKVEESVESIYDKVNQVKTLAKEPSELLENLKTTVQDYIDTGNSNFSSSFSSTLSKLSTAKNNITSSLDAINSATEKYYQYVDKAKSAVSDLTSELESEKSEFDTDTYNAVNEQIKDLNEKSADTDVDFYAVGSNSQAVQSSLEKLGSLGSLFQDCSEPLNEDNAQSYLETVQEMQKSFNGFDLSSLGINYDTTTVSKESDGFLSSISNILENGVLGFVASDISDKSIETADLPSNDSSISDSSEEESSLLDAGTEKALFGEYILTHFGNYTETKDNTALNYEAEYIIAGNGTDKDNLASIVTRIAAIRTGCNLISILKDTEKKLEASTLATSLAGFTGMPVVIKVFQILILIAWAGAEAIVDTKNLLSGHKIKTIKDSDDWTLSIWGLKNFSSSTFSSESSSSNSSLESGLGYTDYLRILLLLQNENKQYMRTMDMIQANMCLNENSEFRISNCITAVQIETTYESHALFTAFRFVSKYLNGGGGKYTFSVSQAYSY